MSSSTQSQCSGWGAAFAGLLAGLLSILGGHSVVAAPVRSILLPALTMKNAAEPMPGSVGPHESFLTQKEALDLAFPKCEIERQVRYLTKEQRAQVAKRAAVDFESAVVYLYRATKDGKLVGTAYFDSHQVRSFREILMVVIAPDGSIRRIEVLAFAEPREYLPRDVWYEQFEKRKLDDDLQLNRGIHNLTGATLSGRATVSCARRLLALHEMLNRGQGEPAAERPARSGDRSGPQGVHSDGNGPDDGPRHAP
jgi:hypothetical protein